MQPVELVRGVWLEEGFPDFGREVIALCDLMADHIADAVLSLTMYEWALIERIERDYTAGDLGAAN
jgi:hypothetical protein